MLETPAGRREGEDREYAGIYAAFVYAVAAGCSDAGLAPLRRVADAYIGREACPLRSSTNRLGG